MMLVDISVSLHVEAGGRWFGFGSRDIVLDNQLLRQLSSRHSPGLTD